MCACVLAQPLLPVRGRLCGPVHPHHRLCAGAPVQGACQVQAPPYRTLEIRCACVSAGLHPAPCLRLFQHLLVFTVQARLCSPLRVRLRGDVGVLRCVDSGPEVHAPTQPTGSAARHQQLCQSLMLLYQVCLG